MVGRKDVSRGKHRRVRKGRKRGGEKHICSLVPLNNKSTKSLRILKHNVDLRRAKS